MKKETYEAQKAFAGEKKPSMLLRWVGHDYTDRQIYMITSLRSRAAPHPLPWEHHYEQITISRNQCLMLNEIARRICEND